MVCGSVPALSARVMLRPYEPEESMVTRTDTSELQARLISAVILGAVTLMALWAGVVVFAALVAVTAAAMAWEWGRAVRGGETDLGTVVQALTTTAACVVTLTYGPALSIPIVLAGAAIVFGIYFGREGAMSALGLLYVGVPSIAMIWLRQDPEFGFEGVLFVLLIVWAHDTFAMLVGRTVGGPKLWPELSPNKTWSGAIGGLFASCCTGLLIAQLLPGGQTWTMAATGLGLGLAALIGDLIESAFKRAYGLKNASALIPGHGGVLDRLDGVIIAVVFATIVSLCINPAMPARALLYWN